MSQASQDKLRGNTNQALGKAKKGLGDLTGNRELQRDGEHLENRGRAQKLSGSIKSSIAKGLDNAARTAKRLGKKIESL